MGAPLTCTAALLSLGYLAALVPCQHGLILRFTLTLTLALSHDGRGDKSASVEFIMFKLTEY